MAKQLLDLVAGTPSLPLFTQDELNILETTTWTRSAIEMARHFRQKYDIPSDHWITWKLLEGSEDRRGFVRIANELADCLNRTQTKYPYLVDSITQLLFRTWHINFTNYYWCDNIAYWEDRWNLHKFHDDVVDDITMKLCMDVIHAKDDTTRIRKLVYLKLRHQNDHC